MTNKRKNDRIGKGRVLLTNLEYLHLGSNQIIDISALSGLTDLTKLYLGYNHISDTSALSGLTDLRELELWGNPINH